MWWTMGGPSERNTENVIMAYFIYFMFIFEILARKNRLTVTIFQKAILALVYDILAYRTLRADFSKKHFWILGGNSAV